MDLKNLLNDGMSQQQGRQEPDADDSRAMDVQSIKSEEGSATTNTSPISQSPKGQPIAGPTQVPPNFNYNYEYHNILKQNLPPGNSPQNLPPHSSLNLPFMQQLPQQQHVRNYLPFQQQVESNTRAPIRNDWNRSPQMGSNNGANASKQYEQYQGTPQQFKSPDKSPRNGHPPSINEPTQAALAQTGRVAAAPMNYEPYFALSMLQRYKTGEIKHSLEIPVKDNGDFLVNEFPETPVIVTTDVYDAPTAWPNTWRLDLLEKTYPELYIKDQKAGREYKRSLKDFRRHIEALPAEDEIWLADVPLMHQLTCVNSKKNRNCMGCSSYWKCVQGIQEELKPWGTLDLLHFEPEHSETFTGHIAMNGSFTPQQREMLSCDSVNTMFYSDEPNAVTVWGLISPAEQSKLTEEEALGFPHFDSKTFMDPAFLEKKVKVLYAVQKVGQTIIIPCGWTYWNVKMGRGLSFSASWNILRLKHITDTRRAVEVNRSLGLLKPLNIGSLLVAAAYQKLDELECVDTPYEKQQSCLFLLRILPILKTLVLEEVLCEPLHLSAMVVLSYDLIVEKLASEGRKSSDLSPALVNELSQVIELPLAALDSDVNDDDEEAQFNCNVCKYILFNTRRSCHQCKNYDLCEPCFSKIGRKHPHKMKRHRKISVQTLLDLVENIRTALVEHEQDERKIEKPSLASRKRDRRDLKDEAQLAPTDQDNYDEEVIECICGNNKDLGFMISCEKCYAWLHGKCVGISKRNEPEVYYCPRCVKKPVVINAKLSPKDISPEEKLKEYNLM
jgi:hypothetical protein